MKLELRIEGMTCGHCVARVRKALSGVPGVERAEVDLVRRVAAVEGAAMDASLLEAAVVVAGYRVVSAP